MRGAPQWNPGRRIELKREGVSDENSLNEKANGRNEGIRLGEKVNSVIRVQISGICIPGAIGDSSTFAGVK